MLPVTDGGQNNKKKSTSNTTTEKKNEKKEDDAWGNDENTPTEQENEGKEDETGEIMMMLSLTVFKLNYQYTFVSVLYISLTLYVNWKSIWYLVSSKIILDIKMYVYILYIFHIMFVWINNDRK